MAGTVFIDGGPPNGLPIAGTVVNADLMVVNQGGTPGVPGTGTDRSATVTVVLAGEVTARTAADAVNAAAITAETTRAEAAEALLAPKAAPVLAAPIRMTGLPTSDVGLASGTLYLNGTFLCVKP